MVVWQLLTGEESHGNDVGGTDEQPVGDGRVVEAEEEEVVVEEEGGSGVASYGGVVEAGMVEVQREKEEGEQWKE